jgi:hypothetical protein
LELMFLNSSQKDDLLQIQNLIGPGIFDPY